MGDRPRQVPAKWRALPARVRPEDMAETQATDPPQDPERGRDIDTDRLMRWGRPS
ncbi:MAG TPA: hypothetical protein VGP02_04695 [Mycobacteriales bacterium]|jgi:hypothetical protein|nr:hypothetical protein [Mycobacteriales bacterium]